MSHTSEAGSAGAGSAVASGSETGTGGSGASGGSAGGGHAPGVRRAQKQQTRQALLDAGMRLLEHQNLSSLGLRELTRAVGVSPAAFYRHFPDMAGLGVALVGEALDSLHGVIRAVLADGADDPSPDTLIDRTVSIIAAYVDGNRPHVRFVARERHGGVGTVREAIAAELDRFADEVAAGLAAQPASAGWSAADLRVLAELYVDHMVTTAAALLEARGDDPAARDRIMRAARLRMRIISIGRRHWLDPEPWAQQSRSASASGARAGRPQPDRRGP